MCLRGEKDGRKHEREREREREGGVIGKCREAPEEGTAGPCGIVQDDDDEPNGRRLSHVKCGPHRGGGGGGGGAGGQASSTPVTTALSGDKAGVEDRGNNQYKSSGFWPVLHLGPF